MGIDLGSVSLNLVIIDDGACIQASTYKRTEGKPLAVLLESLEELGNKFDSFQGVIATGSGRKLLGNILKVPDINEIVTQAKATGYLYPDVRTIMEMGGQDSKLIFMSQDDNTREPIIVDHVLNEVCAAGTGSFLDLQAHRLGISIEEIGVLALQSKHPARIAGRCSVFAKSDMVHLLQEGTPKSDIVAGLCQALALNYITNLGKGKPFSGPIVFQGGVAANPGVVKAFEDRLGLGSGNLIIPENFLVMGAFGSALMAQNGIPKSRRDLSSLTKKIKDAIKPTRQCYYQTCLKPLIAPKGHMETLDKDYLKLEETTQVFLGVDIGAVSTNIVLIDKNAQVVAKQYWYTEGELIKTVRTGLEEIADRMGSRVKVCGVGVTGSGRYFVGEFVGADVVINEISAQAKAAMHFDPKVDTIIEIGGQDSKYIRCKNGRVVDFEMNKVCSAGTGSFLEEQAARLNLPVRESFSALAFSSTRPANLGARCTVFMESDLIHHQQTGKSVNDLAAGLSYAIAQNYQEKVIGSKKVGRHILFQGGVAGNQSVAAAFENILKKPITIPEHHNVTGAMGAALAAMDHGITTSKFAGFRLKNRPYKMKTFECKKCPNVCRINQIYINGKLSSHYGGLCGRYERSSHCHTHDNLPDLFAERKAHLMEGFQEGADISHHPRQAVGIPRALSYFDYFPFWSAYFKALGHPLVLSDETNKGLIQGGLLHVPSETCFPIKAVYGHITDLKSKGINQVLLPCEIDHQETEGGHVRSFNCPYVQSMPYMVKAAIGSSVNLLAPIIRWSYPRPRINRELRNLAKSLGHSPEKSDKAIAAAWQARTHFEKWQQNRGKEILGTMGPNDHGVVLLGKTHNIFDPGLNLHLARKLRRAGQLTIPFDMLPLDEVRLPDHYNNVVWKNTRDLLKALFWIRKDRRLYPVLLTNFGCGPDSFLMKYMETELPDKPHLVLEVDDHTGDAGMITRIEAFLDTLEAARSSAEPGPSPLNLIIRKERGGIHGWGPDSEIMKRLENRTLYFPYVSRAFSQVVGAAFRAIGVKSQVLPKPDDETERLGRQVTSGRECHPFIVTCGEFVKLTRLPGFDPDRSAILMQNYDGACRFSQYAIGHADLLKRLKISQMPVIAPVTSNRFDEFSALFGLHFTRLLWEGWLAAEVLERIRLHTRPYEKSPGLTDRLFADGIGNIAEAVGCRNGRTFVWDTGVLSTLKRSAKVLGAIPVDRSYPRPMVGIVGEFYTVLNRWANQNLIRTLEDLGAETAIHGLTVTNFYALFSGHYYPKSRLRQKKMGSAAYYLLRNQWMMSRVRQAEASLPRRLRPLGTLSAKEIVRESEDFIHHDIDPVLATFTARVRRFATLGVSGICNLFVLNCMLGNITVPIFKKALSNYDGLPILHAVYDGQEGTNMLTRIEAFMHQVGLYQQRL
ncbi:MAG: CoA activase [Deltaproteobacteria bacterium]|nr:CoA activase [Deltaproteobacteria bacterium]